MPFEEQVVRTVTLRLIPMLIVAFIIAYLDRVNISFAAASMNVDLGLSAAAYGLGAGLFFVPYVLLEVPSNVILEKVGARLWITRIMISWALVAGATAFIQGEWSFYLVRVLLGITEAGFFPGVIFLISSWFPEENRGRIGGYFMTAIPLSSVIGGPLSIPLLGLDGIAGLKGWQWLFLIEAIPPLVMAAVIYFYLPGSPKDATWLAPDQKKWLLTRLETENQRVSSLGNHSWLKSLGNPRVLLLGAILFGITINTYGVLFFLPQIVRAFGLSTFGVGMVSAIPFVVGALGILFWGWNSDRMNERRYHISLAIGITIIGVAAAALVDDPIYKMIALCVAGFGMFGHLPAFWLLPATFLRGPALAAGIGAINAIANIAGFAGPSIMGYGRELTGSFSGGLLTTAGIGAVGLVLSLLIRLEPVPDRVPIGQVSPNPRKAVA